MGGKVVVHAKLTLKLENHLDAQASLKDGYEVQSITTANCITAHLQEEQGSANDDAVDQPIFWKLRAR